MTTSAACGQAGAAGGVDRDHAGGADLVDHDEADLPEQLDVVRAGGLADPERARPGRRCAWRRSGRSTACAAVAPAWGRPGPRTTRRSSRRRPGRTRPDSVHASRRGAMDRLAMSCDADDGYLAFIDVASIQSIHRRPSMERTCGAPMQHPVVIIGAGPIGLAAAANAAERGMDFVVLEAGPDAGAAVGEWAHVRLFSAWRELVDPAARRLLDAAGTWTAPDDDAYPTGGEWRDGLPAAAGRRCSTRTAGGSVRYDARVVGVGRAGRDLLVDSGREADPFAVHVEGRHRPRAAARRRGRGRLRHLDPAEPAGRRRLPRPRRDASTPTRITYGIPDFSDPAVAARYAGKHVAVAGKGASAQGVLIGLAELARQRRRHPGLLAAAPPQRRRRVRRRRQRPARAARQARPGRQGRRRQRPGHQRDPVPHRVRHRPGRRAPHAHLGQRPAGRRRRRGHRGHRVPARLRRSSPRSASTSTRPSARARILADQIHPDHHCCGDVAPHGYRSSPSPSRTSTWSG